LESWHRLQVEKVHIVTVTVTSVTLFRKNLHRLPVGKNPHHLPVEKSPHRPQLGKVPHRHYYCHVRDITLPSSNKFPRVVLFILSKTKTKNLLQEVHVIFTWLQLDLVLVLIQTCWIQISLTLGFVGY
jgi:hypothetical protein